MSIFEDLFIFEMANNHQGQVTHGRDIVHAMAKIARQRSIRGAVKLQYRDLDTFIHPDFKGRQDVAHIPRFESTALSQDEFKMLNDYIREEGLLTVVTPFDEVSVGRCLDHGVDILKVASCSATDWPLLEAIAATGRPVIASTGGASLEQIDSLVSFFTHKGTSFALMHCVGIYPMPSESAHMNFLGKMTRRYPDLLIGWSGHEGPDDLDPVKIAVAKGARLLERHVGVPTDTITLNKYSMNPEQVDTWVQAALNARAICGDDDQKHVTQQEIDSLLSLKRGVFARKPIAKGAVISRDDVFFAMPPTEHQTTSGEFGRYRAKYIASKDYEVNEALFERSAPDQEAMIRSVIHDVKGMLYEAQIALGSDFSIELSHHHGIEQIRRTGAIIVSVINRDYCKKLIVVLPGQSHPSHGHKIKEETFQLLWGDLEATVDGKTQAMKPGDKVLVEAGVVHSFRSNGGAVFEEISTTHFRNDSYYEDEGIRAMDPMARKTVITDW